MARVGQKGEDVFIKRVMEKYVLKDINGFSPMVSESRIILFPAP